MVPKDAEVPKDIQSHRDLHSPTYTNPTLAPGDLINRMTELRLRHSLGDVQVGVDVKRKRDLVTGSGGAPTEP